MSSAGANTQRRVLVTGGSRGIGAAVVARYRAEGWTVLAPERAQLNLADPESIERFVQSGALDEIDALVNNAGVNVIAPLEELQAGDVQQMLQINVQAAFSLIRRCAPAMQARGFGRIVNMSSCYSMVSRPGRGGYTMTKSALNGLTRTAALEYSAGGVLVNAVCPGFVETEMTKQNNSPADIARLTAQIPIGRLAQPEEIAAVTYFLGSTQNTYITGQAIPVEGGFLCQ